MTTFKEVNIHLGWKEDEIPNQKFMFIKDTNVDGYFLFHHFLNLFLTQKKNVCILSLNQTFFHFQTIQTKLNLSITEDNVQFINGLPFYTHLLSKYESNPHMWSSPFLKPVEKPKNFHELSIDKTKVLESLYTQITTIFKDKLPDLILIDHINPLLLQNDIFEFIQSLKNLTGKGCTVLLMIHEDEENFQIINFMNHISDLSFSIKGLPTGYSKDVHGEVTFHTENEITLHFKTFDQNVKLFVPGSSNN